MAPLVKYAVSMVGDNPDPPIPVEEPEAGAHQLQRTPGDNRMCAGGILSAYATGLRRA